MISVKKSDLSCAVTIQKSIRGYLARSRVKIIYRNKLVETLKLWGLGNSLSLLDRPGLLKI